MQSLTDAQPSRPPPLPAIKVEAAGKTDVGMQRSVNQDAFLIDKKRGLFVVADGMGGHAGGEIASRICLDTISEYLDEHQPLLAEAESSEHPNPRILSLLTSAVNHASQKIYERALENPNLRGMGTTVTLVKLLGNQAYCAHVGDSRLYLIRCGFTYQMTHDHSLVHEQVKAGLLTLEEAELHSLRNVITRSVGYQEEEEVDTVHFTLEDSDVLLLCTDGLHSKISDGELARTSRKLGIGSTDLLVDLANQKGGEDNISVVIISIQVLSHSNRKEF